MPPQLEDVKTRAENCMKEGKYAEAFFHWTKAIHLVSDKGKKISKAYFNLTSTSQKCHMPIKIYSFLNKNISGALIWYFSNL